MIKHSELGGYKRNIPEYNKGHNDRFTANIIINSSKLKTFTLISGTRQAILFNIELEHQATEIRKAKKKVIQIQKEKVKLSLFAGDMILYVENLKGQRSLELRNKFNKVKKYKINTQISVVSLTLTTNSQKEKLNSLIYNNIQTRKVPVFNQGAGRPVYRKLCH